jgi:hydrogenase maturation protein HypF
VTARLQLAVPTPLAGAGRRRARVHLDGSGPLVVHATIADVTSAAAELGLGGFVRTDPHGVTVEVEGRAAAVTEFLHRICAGPDGACWSPGGELAPMGAGEFAVLAVSAQRSAAAAHRGSDVGLCADCVAMLFDRTHPRFLDPTIGCASCGGDRAGGPDVPHQLRLIDSAGRDLDGNPLKNAMIVLLLGGRILATRDPQRTRLYADATRPSAVAILAALTRSTEGRLVALCPDLEWVRRLAVLDEAEAAALVSRRNPVLLAEPQPVGPALDLTPPDALLAVTLPGCGMTHLMARAAARPLAYLDLPAGAGDQAAGEPAIATLFAQRAI